MTIDIALEIARALVVAALFAFLLVYHRRWGAKADPGWTWVVGGIALLLFGSAIDITDNFETLSRFHVIGETPLQATLEKIVGYLGGFVALAVGLVIWIPSVQRLKAEDRERRATEAELRQRRDELEARVEERTKELRRAMSQVVLANETKTAFMANMSHELRTPLNAILGFAELMQAQIYGPIGNPKYRECAQDIVGSGRYLLDMINDILKIEQIESGAHTLNRHEFDLLEAMQQSYSLVEGQAAEKGIRIRIEMPPADARICADQRALVQVLVNLLVNAIKFTPAGGEVSVEPGREAGRQLIVVRDTGVGIPAEKMPALTDPFTRNEPDPHKSEEGVGLGLAICKSLIELHGGDLVIESEVGAGTTVTVSLPTGLAASESDGAPEVEARRSAG